jgi:hypothetical protein
MRNAYIVGMNYPKFNRVTVDEFAKILRDCDDRTLSNGFEIAEVGEFVNVSVIRARGNRFRYHDKATCRNMSHDIAPGQRFRINGDEYQIIEPEAEPENGPYSIAAKEFLIELHETHLHQCKYDFEIEKKGKFEPVAVTFVGKASFHYYDSGIGRNVYENVTPGDCFRLNGVEYVIKQEWNMADSEPEAEAASGPDPEPFYKYVTGKEFFKMLYDTGEYDNFPLEVLYPEGWVKVKAWLDMSMVPPVAPYQIYIRREGHKQETRRLLPGQIYKVGGERYSIAEATKTDPEPDHKQLPPANILSVGLRAVGIDCDIRTAQLTLDVLYELITEGGSVTIDRCIEIRERWENENERWEKENEIE